MDQVASYEERLRNASETPRGKIVTEHVRGYFISNAYGEAIPHGAMPGKNYPQALLRRFSQCPEEPYSGSTKMARSAKLPESNYKKQIPVIKFGWRFNV